MHNRSENIVYGVSELVGRTPLFELCCSGNGSRLLLKLEQFNPTGSAKVRMAAQMVRDAELSGRLRPGGHIIEPTSGNTGLGLALMAIERGYRFTAVVDHHAAKDKMRNLAALGTDLVYIGEEGTGGPQTMARRERAGELADAEENAHWPDQHNNPGNTEGYRGLAHELLSDLHGDVDYLIGAVGTGGSLCGTAKELRRLGSDVTTIGVEPHGSIIFGGPGSKYWQSGSGSPQGFPVGSNVDYSAIDDGVKVGDKEAFATARMIARRTGLLIGGSAGAAVLTALKRLAAMPAGSTAVTLICDAGEKYLDTVFDDEWMSERGLLDPAVDEELNRLYDGYAGPVPTFPGKEMREPGKEMREPGEEIRETVKAGSRA
ncbi:cysteine synthase family protein [Streptomyces sp. HNM0575]|uniref:PLP-dependent cysteine synthase family protein n=1 Tax=Streptomyces sp. HNM0575 TaxID=2716338 RepID=UPI00145C9BB8|nr:cysteine synthase family protein [Streptomyces sp. HNM0575]NLU75578.1 cysteine synthase family protein [Streptomyces sp. HNM0575]